MLRAAAGPIYAGGTTTRVAVNWSSQLPRQAIDRYRDRHDRRQDTDRADGGTDDSVRDRRCCSGRHDHRSSGHLQRTVAYVEAGPAARCRRRVHGHQRRHPAGRRHRSLAASGKLPVWIGAQRTTLHGNGPNGGTNPYDPTTGERRIELVRVLAGTTSRPLQTFRRSIGSRSKAFLAGTPR